MTQDLRDLYLRRLLLKRGPKMADRIALRTAKLVRGRQLCRIWDSLGELLAKRRIAVLAYSDVESNLYRQMRWGDYWFKYELTKALGRLGYTIVDSSDDPDVVIHLFGAPMEVPHRAHKIIWIHSNPDKVSRSLVAQYDRVCCISESFAHKIRDWGLDCELLPLATSKRPRSSPISYDVVFVGNARPEQGGHRKIIDDLGTPNYRLKVWGGGYSGLSECYWEAEYVDYFALSDLYSSSLICLNDHRPAMVAEGFINPRILDILASGGFCISDSNPALDQVFGDAVPQYRSSRHLRDLIDYYLAHPEAREPLMKKGLEIALSHDWSSVAMELLAGLDPTYEQNEC